MRLIHLKKIGLKAATASPITIRNIPVGKGKGNVRAPIKKIMAPIGRAIQRNRVFIGRFFTAKSEIINN